MTKISTSRLPTVSVVVPLYNYERYVAEALDSVLTQGYPPELLEVVVVDDGSTDGSAAVVRGYLSSHPDVVRLIQQPNSGPEAAVSRGMAHSSGELLALLDADDVWMPGKLLAQVAVLQDRPEVGLVFGDMLPVGLDGAPLTRDLILSQMPVLKRRAGAQVLAGNVASTSAIVARRAVLTPMPPGIPIADWWFTVEAALATEIAWIREPIVRYRIHGEGRSSGRQGVGGAPKLGPFLRDVQFKLTAMRILDLEQFTPLELVQIWEGAEHSAGNILQHSGTHFSHLTSLAEPVPERAAEFLVEADAARDRGDAAHETRLLIKALAWNPYLLGARLRLHNTAQLADRSATAPNPLADARRLVILADAEELLAGDQLLQAYADGMCDLQTVTLAIDASRMDAELAADELTGLVARCGLETRSDVDLLAVVGRRDVIQLERLHAGTTAYYRRPIRTANAVSATREFTPDSLPQLRAVVEASGA